MNYIRKRTNNRYNFIDDPCPSTYVESNGRGLTAEMGSLGRLLIVQGEYVRMPDPRCGSPVRTDSRKLPKAWRVS